MKKKNEIRNMKALIIASLLLLIGYAGFSQEKGFRIGIEGGPNLVSLRGNEIIDEIHSSRISYAFGLAFQYNFSKLLSIRSGIYFEEKGSALEGPFFDLNGNLISAEGFANRFQYLTLPIMARFSFGKKLRYFINTGPFLGFLRESEAVYTTAISEVQQIINSSPGWQQRDGTELLNELDYGISLGAGAEYPLTKNLIISLEVRHNYGLFNISNLPVINDKELNTNSTNMLLGISYLLDK
jgi:opacity protein-like surface antigen